MKYLAFALLSFSHGTQAESFSGNDLNNMFESGMIDKQRLLRNAIPAPRKLQNYNNGGNTQYNSYRNGNGQYSTYNGASAYNNGNNNNVSSKMHKCWSHILTPINSNL